MTQKIFLDPDRLAELEPWEGDEQHRSSLSAYAIPRNVTIRYDPAGETMRISFEYAGGESGVPPEPLDEELTPKILVAVGIHTQKVLELTVVPALSPSVLDRVAERLKEAAGRCVRPARRLSYLMTAIVVEVWLLPALKSNTDVWRD